MSGKYITELERKVLALVKEAQNKKENAKKFKAKHYFDGQSDAFNQVLLDLKKLKYELEAHTDDNDLNKKESEDVTVKKRGPKSKTKIPEKTPEELYPEEAALLKEAKDAGVITQKSSHYFYEAFTTGKEPGRVQGRINVFKELAKEELAQKIREQLAQ